MTEEIEIETKDLQDTIAEIREERAERAKEAKESSWVRYISLSTALLAVVAAVAALHAGSLANEALVAKNNSVLKQNMASDQWAYYQAKGIKSNNAVQTAVILSAFPGQSSQAAKMKAEAKRYKQEQGKIQSEAHSYEEERDADNKESALLFKNHETFAYCVTFVQVAIALSAIAALTKRKFVWYLSMLAGVAGVMWFASGYMQTVTKEPKPETAHSVPEK